MVARNVEGRQKAFDVIEKLIAQGEPIRFIDISKLIGVPSTTVKRVYDENFKGKGILGRAPNSSKVIDEIISTGVVDKDEIKKIAKNKYKINIEDRNIIKKLKRYNLVIKPKVVRLQVYFNLKRLTRFTITKALLLQVVTMLKKMVNL